MSLANEIVELSKQHPDWTAVQLSEHFGCNREYINTCVRRYGITPSKDYGRQSWSAPEIEKLLRLRDEEGKIWGDIAIAMGRPRSSCQHKYADLHSPPIKTNLVADRVTVSQDAIAERNYRANLEHRDLTAAFFGDPKPGFSALERRA